MNPNNAVTTRVWLRRLRWSLSALPRADRDDVTCEIESHISDRIAQGMIEEHVLTALDPPECYARAFLDDFELNAALANQGLLAMGKVALHRITRSLAAFVGVVAAGCLGVMAMALRRIRYVVPDLTGTVHLSSSRAWGTIRPWRYYSRTLPCPHVRTGPLGFSWLVLRYPARRVPPSHRP
ncbi:HAAS signaling domain-containing protein [Luteibacter sahnii]|uniref:HAAS signaling domain-containing protein n=1 Tax=Luteibacter sahnii TaxID=3021977 RepID=UPI00387E588E